MINYFNIAPFHDDFLITNDFNEYAFVKKRELADLINDSVDYSSDYGIEMLRKGFAYLGSRQDFIESQKDQIRRSKGHLFRGTGLHIFVVTDACNLQCIYCQAKTGDKKQGHLMTTETAEKAVDLALSSPEDYLTFEFQGGEPLINFPTIKHIVEYAEAQKRGKEIAYNLVSNLTLMTDDIIDFIKQHNINLCCSIDGNRELHDYNRHYGDGRGSFSDVEQKVQRLREYGIRSSAIQTTTKSSLSKYKEIIDTYRELGLPSVFLRPLTPLGEASSKWDEIGYTPEEFVEFYRKALDYIISINLQGEFFSESFAAIVLRPLLMKESSNYMELRSPCGASNGQLTYYHDGNIYTCDEGRMLAEMGNDAFRLGSVYSSYNELFDCSTCRNVCASSIIESIPGCSDCVYHPFCGTCPVLNYALDGDILPKGSGNYKCRIYKGVFDVIFNLLYQNKSDVIKVLESWVF